MTSPEIEVFAFAYHFVGKTCKRIYVDKKLCRAADIRDLKSFPAVHSPVSIAVTGWPLMKRLHTGYC